MEQGFFTVSFTSNLGVEYVSFVKQWNRKELILGTDRKEYFAIPLTQQQVEKVKNYIDKLNRMRHKRCALEVSVKEFNFELIRIQNRLKQELWFDNKESKAYCKANNIRGWMKKLGTGYYV